MAEKERKSQQEANGALKEQDGGNGNWIAELFAASSDGRGAKISASEEARDSDQIRFRRGHEGRTIGFFSIYVKIDLFIIIIVLLIYIGINNVSIVIIYSAGGKMVEQKGILDGLAAASLRGQIQVDFDVKNKFYQLSVPVFADRLGLPEAIKSYVESRKENTFKPHSTTFQIKNIGGVEKVFIVQQIGFEHFGPRFLPLAMRREVDHFWKMAKKCRSMFSEISLEEKFKDALDLGSGLAD